MVNFKQIFMILCLVLAAPGAAANTLDLKRLHASQANGDYEPAVVGIIELIQAGDLSLALQQADEHLAKFPKSRVGYFLKADVLKAMSEPLQAPGIGLSENAQNVADFKHQIRNRWRHRKSHQEQAHTLFPASLIELGSNPYALIADMPEGRLYLYRNSDGRAELIRDYYMSVGTAGYGKQSEGDNKTPVGVYVFNQYIEGKALPDLYGKGAFPVNYPNRFDRYRKRTGYGIWLHGTPSDTYARSPLASEGCFVLSNDDLLDIGQYISVDDRTPVILSDQIEWLSAEALEQRKAEYYSVINDWKSDWESLNTDAYLQHYSQDLFNLGKGKYKPWAQRKAQVNLSKTFVQVDLELQSLFVYPGEEDMFVVKYKQRYLSNNYSGETAKEQYWKRSANGRWQIIYEG
jgi:murein L,D-transpeptidase YafK